MFRCAVVCSLLGWAGGMAQESREQLPVPDYQAEGSDPAWLGPVVRFHGHLGPAVVAGARLGMAGLRAVAARGYFDVEVTCEGPFVEPPRSCFLDGVQVATGATLGKRTLHWKPSERIAVQVKNTRTGKTARVAPRPALLELLASFKGQPRVEGDHGASGQAQQARLEAVSRQIASLPLRDLLTITVQEPPGKR